MTEIQTHSIPLHMKKIVQQFFSQFYQPEYSRCDLNDSLDRGGGGGSAWGSNLQHVLHADG